jgi:hypothetical protein
LPGRLDGIAVALPKETPDVPVWLPFRKAVAATYPTRRGTTVRTSAAVDAGIICNALFRRSPCEREYSSMHCWQLFCV